MLLPERRWEEFAVGQRQQEVERVEVLHEREEVISERQQRLVVTSLETELEEIFSELLEHSRNAETCAMIDRFLQSPIML